MISGWFVDAQVHVVDCVQLIWSRLAITSSTKQVSSATEPLLWYSRAATKWCVTENASRNSVLMLINTFVCCRLLWLYLHHFFVVKTVMCHFSEKSPFSVAVSGFVIGLPNQSTSMDVHYSKEYGQSLLLSRSYMDLWMYMVSTSWPRLWHLGLKTNNSVPGLMVNTTTSILKIAPLRNPILGSRVQATFTFLTC